MNIEKKRGLVLGILGALAAVMLLAFASATISENFQFTSTGCSSGAQKMIPKVVNIQPGTEVCARIPSSSLSSGYLYLLSTEGGVGMNPGCMSANGWLSRGANQCCKIVAGSSISFTGIGGPCQMVAYTGNVTYTVGSGTCVPDTCTGLGKQCGNWSDGCGGNVSCPSCPSGQICNSTGQCVTCIHETNATFCSRLGKNCGSVSETDNCGSSRTVAECGPCATGTCNSTGQCVVCTDYTTTVTTSAGECGLNNIIVTNGVATGASHSFKCSPRGDVCWYNCYAAVRISRTGDYLQRVNSMNHDCSVSGQYNDRLDVGGCKVADYSDKHTATISTNWCRAVGGCTPETDDEFCTRLGKQCGEVTAEDNCEVSRTADCGTCTTGTCNSTGQCTSGEINNNDIILRLSAKKDALGANATFNSYAYNASYRKIFGRSYIGSNPHACTGNNTVLKLNASSQAHAFAPNATGNYVSICYGDLKCALKRECVAGEQEVVSLSNTNDALLALPGESSYQYRICCLSGAERGYYWINANNQIIISANVDSRVRLVARTGLGENVSVNFTIWESDSASSDDLIRTNLIVNTSSDGIAMYEWRILDSDMTKAGAGSLEEGNRAEFYFIANYTGREANNPGKSGVLVVSSYGAPCNIFFLDNSGLEKIIEYCDDYNYVDSGDKQSQCEEDCNNAADNEKELHEDELDEGERIINSKCEWRESDSKCRYTYDISTGDDDDDFFVPGTCKQFVDYSPECRDGYRTASYTYKKEVTLDGVKILKARADWNPEIYGPWDCFEPSVKQIPCPSAVEAVLPFFSVFNMIAAMSVIALVYVILLFRREFR